MSQKLYLTTGEILKNAGEVFPMASQWGLSADYTWTADNDWHDVNKWTVSNLTTRSITPTHNTTLIQLAIGNIATPATNRWSGLAITRTAPSSTTCTVFYNTIPVTIFYNGFVCIYEEILVPGYTYTYKIQVYNAAPSGTATFTGAYWVWLPIVTVAP